MFRCYQSCNVFAKIVKDIDACDDFVWWNVNNK